MPTLPSSQQSDWNSNVYVLAVTRIFVVIGIGYLVKSMYNLISSTWGTRSASVAAVVADGIVLQEIASDTLFTMPEVVGSGSDLEADLSLEVRPPQPTYDPRIHAERFWANPRDQHQTMDVLGPSATAQTSPEQQVVFNHGDHHVEEAMNNIVVVNPSRERTMESAADEAIGGIATQTQGDVIRSPFDA